MSKKSKINSRAKGARGERLCRDLLRKHGYEARRGQQFSGGKDSPDVVSSLEGHHIEVKFVESFNAYKAMEQASRDCEGTGKVPIVFHKRKGKEWLVVLKAEDYLQLLDDKVMDEV